MNRPFRRICFVVMPYGTRDTGAQPPAPARVNFDALWEFAIAPALEKLDYQAVRADQDMGPLIIKEMLERLYFSDLVVADVSIANANAYYEVGIRHAARDDNCVLIAADWARPVFDLAQMRHVPYPNAVLALDAATGAPIVDALVDAIPKWAASKTPMRETIAGYPMPAAEINGQRARELAGELQDFETLRAAMAAIASMPKALRKPLAQPILEQHPAAQTVRASLAVEMVRFIRDCVEDWSLVEAYIDALPAPIRNLPFLCEQHALALAKQNKHVAAIAALNTVIALAGDSSERQGLLGGCYKKLYDASVAEAGKDTTGTAKPQTAYLTAAIQHYEQGTQLDLNDYYPSCNLPSLYRARGGADDEARAIAVAALARFACERSLKRNPDDPWGKSTLLGLAFAERNAAAAQEIAQRVIAQNGAGWQLQSTLADLRRHVAQTQDPGTRAALGSIVDALAAVVG